MAQTELARDGRGYVEARPAARRAPLRALIADRPAQATALATLAVFAASEMVTVFTDPFTGIALHGATLTGLLVASGFGAGGDGVGERPLNRLLFALALVPLIRIVSLTMPLGRFEEAYWFVAAGAPVFVAGAVVMATLGLRPRDVDLRPTARAIPLQLAVVVLGLGLGFAEYQILHPEPLIDELTLGRFILPAFILMFATGFLEEFIFRGILQRTAGAALGPPAILYVSLIFAVLHIGYRSGPDFLFVFIIALIYGWVVRQTGSIIGVSVSHGITNITLFLVMPFIPVLAAPL